MRIILLFILLTSLWSAEEPILKAQDWKQAQGNENNFDIWAVSVKHDALWKIDLKTGDIHQIGKLGVDISNAGLSFDNKGVLYMLYSTGNNVCLATIDTKTGAATKIVDYKTHNNATIGFEISQNGKHMYWISTHALYEIFMDGKVTEIMNINKDDDLKEGSWCLSRDKGGNLLAVGLKTKQLMTIDPIKKTVVMGKKLETKMMVPALSLTPGNRQYLCDFSGKIFGIDENTIYLGTISDTCHGFAVINKPKAE